MHAAADTPGDVEVVERKGVGHPDTICDGLAEEISRALCRYYRQEFGIILHHNVDKILLCGGAARPAFGGGKVLEPLELYLGGRATAEFQGRHIPVAELAVEACRGWLRSHLPELDVDRHVRLFPKFRPGSGALRSLYSKGLHNRPLANDTACGAGFAPLTPLERTVLDIEKTLTSPATKRTHPAFGLDVKVMGIRRGSHVWLTISCAMVGRHLDGIETYAEAKSAVARLALEIAGRQTGLDCQVTVNAADDLEKGDIFLTVTGTSAEAGDDGEVGRGNRTCGLITPYRIMTIEAAAGKNPVTHVGKLYNLTAAAVAGRVVRELAGVRGASCVLVSQIGRPVDDPQIADVGLALRPGESIGPLAGRVRELLEEELDRLPQLQTALLNGDVCVY